MAIFYNEKVHITFDDVLIRPAFSDVISRETISLKTKFVDREIDLPIISANMDYITEITMAQTMVRNGGMYIYHRHKDSDEIIHDIWNLGLNHNGIFPFPISFSVGIRDDNYKFTVEEVLRLVERDIYYITIDVAHGYHERVGLVIKWLKAFDSRIRVIAGNIATHQGFWFLTDQGADAVKVGIGPGAVCTTRTVAGAGVPQLSAIMDIYNSKINHNYNTTIIADGGIRSSGDIVKALAAGADQVMLGHLLSGTDETPGEVRIAPDGTNWKPYRGQSSFGVNGERRAPEGIEGWVEVKGPVGNVLTQLKNGIKSGMSYVGAKNIEDLRELAEFILVSPNTMHENSTRVIQKL
jgi:IMP dehydrogenase